MPDTTPPQCPNCLDKYARWKETPSDEPAALTCAECDYTPRVAYCRRLRNWFDSVAPFPEIIDEE